jgi:site-specific DNA-methyltransferase (adenine-specific)
VETVSNFSWQEQLRNNVNSIGVMYRRLQLNTKDIDLGRLEIVPISEIEFDISQRGREEYGNVEELQGLAENIRTYGLIQPIAIYSESGNPPYALLAGGRRLLVCKEILHIDEISARIYTTKRSERELRAIEYFENIHRKELTWNEKDKMYKAYHDLRVDAKGNSQAETAKELGVTKSTLTASFKRLEVMEKVPDLNLGAAKNAFAADKIVQSLGQALSNHTLVADINKILARETTPVVTNETETSITTSKIHEKNPGVIVHTTSVKNVEPQFTISTKKQLLLSSYKRGDFFENKLQANYFDLIECDPPYGIPLNTNRKQYGGDNLAQQEYEEPDEDAYELFLVNTIDECWRVGKENSWLLLWHSASNGDLCKDLLDRRGYKLAWNDALWIKGTKSGYTNHPDKILGHQYEMFTYARKGNPSLVTKGHGDVFTHNVVPQQHLRHPTERPISLIKEILSVFTFTNARVLSPFLGSGNTILAANELKMSCVGYDTSQIFYERYFAHVIKMPENLEMF